MPALGHFGRSQSLSAAPPLRPTPHLYEDLTKLSAVARFANCQVRWTQLRPVQRPSAYSPRLDNREAAGALVCDFHYSFDRVMFAHTGRQVVKRQDDDTGGGLAMPNRHLTESPVVGDLTTRPAAAASARTRSSLSPRQTSLASTTSRPRWISPSTIARATHSSAKKVGTRGSFGCDDPLMG